MNSLCILMTLYIEMLTVILMMKLVEVLVNQFNKKLDMKLVLGMTTMVIKVQIFQR